MKVKMIDPPKGWLYGFPKEIPEDIDNTTEWLIDNGYPEHDVDWAAQHMRWWPVGEGDEDETMDK